MINSSQEIVRDEKRTLEYLSRIALFCLNLTSEISSIQVIPTGDGQQLITPQGSVDQSTFRELISSIQSYSDSLSSEFPGYSIRAATGTGPLQQTPLGLNGAILWELDRH